MNAAAENHWLLKSEPESYSIDDLASDKTTFWSGVRIIRPAIFCATAVDVRFVRKFDALISLDMPKKIPKSRCI